MSNGVNDNNFQSRKGKLADPQNNAIPSSSGQASEDDGRRRETVAEIAARLREGEDLRMAMKLQEEEFKEHFSKNRNQRMTVAKDTKLSRAEQQAEQRRELEERMREAAEIAQRDERMAWELHSQMEEEERKRMEEQAGRDEELARKLQKEDGGREGGGAGGGEDAELAERMQRQLIRNFRKKETEDHRK